VKRYFDAPSRAEFAWSVFRDAHKGRVLDVGAGGSSQFYRSVLPGRYVSADITDIRATPDVWCNFEQHGLPFTSRAFDTVICYDVLEHVDSPHRLFDECARVASRSMIVALPNNWPSMAASLVAGHNRTHRKGYGLATDEPLPGIRHKWFFNLEEGELFLRARADRAGWSVARVEHVYERGSDSLFRWEPLKRFGIPGYARMLGIPDDIVRRRHGRLFPLYLLVKYGVMTPVSYVEELFKRLVWGWGRYRYQNLFCRQLWIVFERVDDRL
jgi:SAM-dependent methyltransferase